MTSQEKLNRFLLEVKRRDLRLSAALGLARLRLEEGTVPWTSRFLQLVVEANPGVLEEAAREVLGPSGRVRIEPVLG